MSESITENFHNLCEDAKRTAEKCGRPPGSIKIVLVTKHQPIAKINEAIKAGADQLAENYPELLLPKVRDLIDLEKITWHMIGHIQSRKTNIVMDYFDYVHSIDDERIAQRLENRGNEINKVIPVLLEVNLGGEETKNGYRVETPTEYQTILDDIKKISEMSHLKLSGLMVMPPFTIKPEDSRKYFEKLRLLSEKVNHDLPALTLNELSMGTSQDYQVAIEEGATMLRIGTKVFGDRR